MEEFLKKYSKVPNGFISDFFNLNKESYIDNEFMIDFDKIVKWLTIRKDNLKRLLIANFEQNYDYIIEKEKRRHKNYKGGNLVEIITLTPDCFKELCMLSQTAKAK